MQILSTNYTSIHPFIDDGMTYQFFDLTFTCNEAYFKQTAKESFDISFYLVYMTVWTLMQFDVWWSSIPAFPPLWNSNEYNALFTALQLKNTYNQIIAVIYSKAEHDWI